MTKLFWTAKLCYTKAFFAMSSRRSVQAAWQGAPGQRLTVAIMLPGRQDADDWLNFMLSQKNLWPTFATRGTLTPNRPSAKSGAGCRPSMSGWSSCAGAFWLIGCTQRPRLVSQRNNSLHCFSTRLLGAQRIPMKKKPTVDPNLLQSRHGGNNAKSGCFASRVKAPLVLDLHGLIQAFRGKEASARAEVEALWSVAWLKAVSVQTLVGR